MVVIALVLHRLTGFLVVTYLIPLQVIAHRRGIQHYAAGSALFLAVIWIISVSDAGRLAEDGLKNYIVFSNRVIPVIMVAGQACLLFLKRYTGRTLYSFLVACALVGLIMAAGFTSFRGSPAGQELNRFLNDNAELILQIAGSENPGTIWQQIEPQMVVNFFSST